MPGAIRSDASSAFGMVAGAKLIYPSCGVRELMEPWALKSLSLRSVMTMGGLGDEDAHINRILYPVWAIQKAD